MIPSKECVTCKDFHKHIWQYPCHQCNDDHNFWKPILEPIETKKMKSTSKRIIEALKEMFTFSDSVNLVASRVTSIVCIPYLCFIAMTAVGTEITTSTHTFEGMVTGLLMTIGIWLLGYFSRRPDPNRKGFKKWLKICKLKIQIGILKKNLKPFNDLRKYRHKSESHIREMVKEWRLELKKLKRELNKL